MLLEPRIKVLAGGSEPRTIGDNCEPNYSNDPFDEPPETHLEPSLSPEQEAWLGYLVRMGDAYPLSPYADKTRDELEAMARIWADELFEVPLERISECYREMMRCWKSEFAPQVGSLRAAWERVQSQTPRETFQQRERRENAGRYSLPQHPASHGHEAARLFQKVGRCVVCKCEGDRWGGIPAKEIYLSSRSQWVCARGKCDFVLDSQDEAGLRRYSTEPLLVRTGGEFGGGSIRLESNGQSRAEMFAESVGVVWEKLDEAQREAMRGMAKWNDWKGKRVNAENFEEKWGEYWASLGVEGAVP